MGESTDGLEEPVVAQQGEGPRCSLTSWALGSEERWEGGPALTPAPLLRPLGSLSSSLPAGLCPGRPAPSTRSPPRFSGQASALPGRPEGSLGSFR